MEVVNQQMIKFNLILKVMNSTGYIVDGFETGLSHHLPFFLKKIKGILFLSNLLEKFEGKLEGGIIYTNILFSSIYCIIQLIGPMMGNSNSLIN